ncbi:hypothetical protein [Cytobacillus massiliigabonensis]|uniref:hypothetical protein n=1 Tax=Cytobacillus massiliigabonensis TaxID=1871011 RepID=UPI000C8467EE|nr:hypothetical protein [Cytobacillus massiliigabonensis]
MQTLFVVFFIIIRLFFGVWKRLNEFYPILIDHLIFPTQTIIATAIAFLIYQSVIVLRKRNEIRLIRSFTS